MEPWIVASSLSNQVLEDDTIIQFSSKIIQSTIFPTDNSMIKYDISHTQYENECTMMLSMIIHTPDFIQKMKKFYNQFKSCIKASRNVTNTHPPVWSIVFSFLYSIFYVRIK